DYDDQNYVVATRPTSPFVQRLVVQRTGAEIRHSLTDLTLTSHLPDGRRYRRDIMPAEIPDALRVLFKIRLPPELECALVERTGEPRDPHPADVSFGA